MGIIKTVTEFHTAGVRSPGTGEPLRSPLKKRPLTTTSAFWSLSAHEITLAVRSSRERRRASTVRVAPPSGALPPRQDAFRRRRQLTTRQPLDLCGCILFYFFLLDKFSLRSRHQRGEAGVRLTSAASLFPPPPPSPHPQQRPRVQLHRDPGLDFLPFIFYI